jgi:DsbC/DsbD-like thiol-disulfide interchange protein
MAPAGAGLNPPCGKDTVTICRRKVISLFPATAYVADMTKAPLALFLSVLATAANATTQDDVLSATLRPGWRMDSGAHMAAVDLTLAPGWKTYWRSPGDAGIPPSFDWSGSKNVKSVRIHWPAPSVFDTNGMQTIGYHDRLLLPIEVVAQDPSKPVRLEVSVDLGVCDKICLPASLALQADLTAPGAPDAGIQSALQSLATSAGEAGVTTVSCAIDPISDGLRVTARVRLPDPGSPEVVAFETADPAVWVSEAVTQREGGDLVTMTELVPPDGAPFALDRSGLVMTILSQGRAVEVRGCPAP